MAILLLVALAIINLIASIAFLIARNWPWALSYFGGFLILVGNVWAIVRES